MDGKVEAEEGSGGRTERIERRLKGSRREKE